MADVQPGGRLIQQHNLCLLGQHHRNPRPLALAAGERIDALQRQVADSGRPHRVVYRRFIFFAPTGEQRLVRVAPAGHQLLHRDIARSGGILRQQSDAAGNLFRGILLDLRAVEPDMAAGRRHQAAEGAQQRRFAAAVGADNGGEVAVRDGHVQRLGDSLVPVGQG